MAKEIERKFLLRGVTIPLPDSATTVHIKQAYILAKQDKQVRVRILDGVVGSLCVKYTGGPVRDEFEYSIPVEDAQVMFDNSTQRLEKKRISFQEGGAHYDIDEFPNGISFVEVEFSSLEHMNSWVKPGWLGEDVTHRSDYSNIVIAGSNTK